MSLGDDLTRIAAAAASHVEEGEVMSGVVAAEAGESVVYLCAFERGGERAWLALDSEGRPVSLRATIREAASLAALCELAAETAGGGDLPELRARLLQVRLTEAPLGIEEAEAAALALEQTIGSPPRLAGSEYLDRVGAAARRLEQALGEPGQSPFAAAMQAAVAAADELADDVEAHYKLPVE